MRKEAELLNPTGNERKNQEHSSSVDQFINDDSTSNQSDSSASSSARQANTRSTGPEQVMKRTLMTKNAGTTDKRRRVASGSGITFIKREPQTELNDEVCFCLIHKK